MNILFDDHIIGQNKTGLYRYTKNLIEGLDSYDINLSLYTKSHHTFNNGLYRLMYGFANAINNFHPEILHVQNFAPFKKTIPIVNTVHDLCFLEDPNSFSIKSRLAFSLFFKHSLQISDRIIAVSESVKKQLIQKYNIDAKKIDVIYEAADSCFFNISDKKKCSIVLQQKYGITEPYFLVVGSDSRRKNIEPIIKAHAKLLQTNPNMLLIITGKLKTAYKNVINLTHISDKDLNLLYNGTEALIMNSTCEGFGLPLVEAMQCKIPIICNDIKVFHEICGESAIYTQDSKTLQSAMSSLLEKNQNEKYSDFVHKQGKQYSWDITIKKTVEVYNKVLTTNDN